MYYGDSRGGIDIVLEYSHVSPPDPSSKPMYAVSARTPSCSKSLELPLRELRVFAVKLPLADLIVAIIDLVPQTRMLTGRPQKPSSNE